MKENEHSAKMNRFVHLWPLTIIIAGILACAAGATISQTYRDFFGLLLLISLASLLCGAVFGFLFGIPRLNRNYDPREDYQRTTKYTPNTNLEDVSDWLTKIIIGVTLTQLTKIPGYLQSLADNILLNNSCETLDCNFARPVIISCIIYFFIAGFITGYFYTRLYLPNLFSIMEENSIRRAEIAIWREGNKMMQHTSGESDASRRIASLTDDERKILQKIKAQNNMLTELNRLSHPENAAVNVLLAKGLVEVIPGSFSHRGDSLRIVDEDLLQLLQ